MAAGQPFSPESIASIALSVEPTDGVMFPGIALFDHRCGSIAESLGAPPPMEVIVIDTGGTVDTLEFNRTDRTALVGKGSVTHRRSAGVSTGGHPKKRS